MHCLVEITGDEYEILSASENEEDLLAEQSANPLRMVLSAETLAASNFSKREKRHTTKAHSNGSQLH